MGDAGEGGPDVHYRAPRKACAADTPVFDRGSRDYSLSSKRGRPQAVFRRTANDLRPCTRNVTAALMGDPGPGRSALDQV